MLYTIVALEDVFYSPEEQHRQYRSIPYGMAMVTSGQEGDQISSVFSTDPYVYLNPKYQIGQAYH